MDGVIVTCHSKTGTTSAIAGRIASVLGCATDAIRVANEPSGLFGLVSAGLDVLTGQSGPVKVTHDPAAHRLVIVGTPVWAGKASGPVLACLRRFKNSFTNVAFFTTSGMTGGARAFAEMESAAGKKAVATLDVLAIDLASGTATAKIDSFTREVKAVVQGTV